MFRACSNAICCEIPIDCRIGPGFLLLHGYGVVFNKRSVAGSNLTVFHHVTVGATRHDVPNIGSGIVLGAGSMILGSVKIDDDVTVGAGSVVIKDVERGAVVAGNPAVVVRKYCDSRVKNPIKNCGELI